VAVVQQGDVAGTPPGGLATAAFLAVLLVMIAAPLAAQPADALPESRLVVESASGARFAFQVELALTPEHQARGLMFRTELAADRGMLFDFGESRPVSMWMRNTYIPLDMLFIEADGRIRHIAARTVPLSEESITADGPVRAVLELRGGVTDLLGIRPGDRVLHPIFGSDPGGASDEASPAPGRPE
jgi:uncharacterized protein